MNTCETCKHWKKAANPDNPIYCNNDKFYECFPRNRILYPTKDFGCIHWEENPHQQRIKCAEGFFNESEITKAIDRMGGVFMMIDSQTNVIVQARNKDWIGHEFEPEIHIPPNSKENP